MKVRSEVRFIRASMPRRTPAEWYESVFKCWVGRQRYAFN